MILFSYMLSYSPLLFHSQLLHIVLDEVKTGSVSNYFNSFYL